MADGSQYPPARQPFLDSTGTYVGEDWLRWFTRVLIPEVESSGGGSSETGLSEEIGFTADLVQRIEDLENALFYAETLVMPEPTTWTTLGRFKIQKDLTFANDTGTLTLFTVTGDVFVNIIPVVTTTVTSAAAANIRLGVIGETDAMIVDSLSTEFTAREIWVSQTPAHETETLDRKRAYIVTDGNDVVVTLDAQVDTGAISFYCFWTALSADGKVVAT